MLTPVFLAAPSTVGAPPVAPAAFPGLKGVRWEAWDGVTWDLLDPAAGTFLAGEVRGLTMPTGTRYTTSSPAVAGTSDLGEHVDEREAFWPLFVWHDGGSQAWIERDRAFWRGLRRGKFGSWVVVHPDGTERRLRCRFVDDGGHSYPVDPTRKGWALYGVTLVAPMPYWQGTPVVRSFKAADPVEFFQADGLHISPGSHIDSASIPNDGDVEGWLVWTITGPTTSVSVGVGGDLVEVPFPLAAGESLTIDTHPTAQTAIDHTGADRTDELGAVDFAPVEPGERVDLDITVVGTGYVTATLTPLYERAW